MPLAECANVNNWNNIFFSTVLNKLFHITDVYIYPQDKIITEVIKMTHSKVYIRLNLNTMCHFWMIHKLFLYFVIVVHESLVCPEQFKLPAVLQKKSSSSCTFFAFPASSAYFEPFPKWLYDFEIHIFTLRTTEDSYTTITKVKTFTDAH